MTAKLVTIEELMSILNLKKDSVISLEYNQWGHNHPFGKLEFKVSIIVDKSSEVMKKMGINDD